MNKRTLFAIPGALFLAACAAGAPSPAAREPDAADRVRALRITPNPARFDETVIGCTQSVALQLDNPNPDVAIAIVSAREPNAALRLVGGLPVTVPPGGSQSLELQFAPLTSGDWSGVIRFGTEGARSGSFALSVTAIATKPPLETLDLTRLEALDLVVVLDVSTTMYETAALRTALRALFDFAETHGLDVRFGLVTFVNDVIVHGDGAVLDRAAFFEALDSQLVAESWIPNPALPRQLLNFDLPENSLGALHRAATEFAFRPGARRYFLLMTDDTFLEPPKVFSDRTPAIHSHAEVSDALLESGVRLFAVHDSAHGAGLSTPYRGDPALVTQTDGAWFELSEVSAGSLSLDELLTDLVIGPVCEPARAASRRLR